MGEVTLVLKAHSFLWGLDDAQIASLAKVVELVQFSEQELILSVRQKSLDFYLLISGTVSIELTQRRCVVRIQSLGPGDAFGWSALLEHHDTLFDVRTQERCTALRLTVCAYPLSFGKTLSSLLIIQTHTACSGRPSLRHGTAPRRAFRSSYKND